VARDNRPSRAKKQQQKLHRGLDRSVAQSQSQLSSDTHCTTTITPSACTTAIAVSTPSTPYVDIREGLPHLSIRYLFNNFELTFNFDQFGREIESRAIFKSTFHPNNTPGSHHNFAHTHAE
jgi:hypothetical protein